MGIWWAIGSSRIHHQQSLQEEQSRKERLSVMQSYLASQTDAHKLVKLLKNISYEDQDILRAVTLKAYELDNNNRDIAILASYFDDGAKKRVIELDPLYTGN